MAKRPKRPRDPNQLAKLIVDLSVGEVQEEATSPSKRRAGGLKGGPARAVKLPAVQRRDIARLAAQARWKKKS